jgi:catechol 2,3-dioxygenase-like lactoylglutathione lyase family enzyme
MATLSAVGNETASSPTASRADMKFELVGIPVSDVDRAKEFYGRLGWRLDADHDSGADFRIVQFTPPGSGCSIIFGKNVTGAASGSAQGLYLIVSDIEAARNGLIARGIRASEIFHGGAVYTGPDQPFLFGRKRVSGPDEKRGSYRSFISFSDPDGNGWFMQRDHHTGAGADRFRHHEPRVGWRSGERASPCGSGTRPARGTDGTTGRELAGLVRRVYGARAERQRTAAMTRFDAITPSQVSWVVPAADRLGR